MSPAGAFEIGAVELQGPKHTLEAKLPQTRGAGELLDAPTHLLVGQRLVAELLLHVQIASTQYGPEPSQLCNSTIKKKTIMAPNTMNSEVARQGVTTDSSMRQL